MPNAKQIIGGTFEDIGEAVVKPVIDEVGRAAEQGIQTTVHGPTYQPTTNPSQDQTARVANENQRAAVDQGKAAEVRRRLNWIANLQQGQKKEEQQKKQKITEEEQQEQQKKQIIQFESVKKENKNIALQRVQQQKEIKGGVGG